MITSPWPSKATCGSAFSSPGSETVAAATHCAEPKALVAEPSAAATARQVAAASFAVAALICRP
jgi:hypothetical protein